MKKVVLDNIGIPKAFYDDLVHTDEQITDSAVEITEEQYQELINFQGLRRFNLETSQVENYKPILSLEASKKIKKEEISQNFKTKVSEGFTTSLDIKMDGDLAADILPFDGGVRLSEKLGLPTMNIRDFDNMVHTVTIEEANTIVNELGINHQTLLSTKWTLNSNVDDALTIENVEAITWA